MNILILGQDTKKYLIFEQVNDFSLEEDQKVNNLVLESIKKCSNIEEISVFFLFTQRAIEQLGVRKK